MQIVINGDHKTCLLYVPFAVKFYDSVASQGKVQSLIPLPTQKQVGSQLKGDAEGFVYVNTEKELLIIRTRNGVIVVAGYLEIANALSELIANAATARANIGLGNVNNTSDANKPVSTAQQSALDLKANLNSPTFTGTVGGITAAMVGLGNVNNTSDANKPISTATQAALNLKLDSSTLPTTTSANSGQSLLVNAAGDGYTTDSFAKGFRNKLLNGDFQVWQRGTTFTDPTGTSNMYFADRWAAFRSAWTAGITVTQQSTQTNSTSIRVQRNSGNASTSDMFLNQSLETVEVKKLAGKSITLQFKALKGANFSEASSALTAQIIYGTGSNGSLAAVFTSQAVAGSSSVTLTTTNTLFQLTANIPSNATQLGVQLSYTPTSTAGASDYFEVTDIQLEEGSIATPFERRSYGLELALCQRFFRRLVNKTGNHSIGNGVAISTTGMQLQRYLDIEMRIAPALVLSSAADFICINSTGGTAGTASAITLGITKPNVVRFDVSVTSGLTAGNAASCQSQNTSATLDLNSEL